jgi:hypothetical protein
MTYCLYADGPCNCQPDEAVPCRATRAMMMAKIDRLDAARTGAGFELNLKPVAEQPESVHVAKTATERVHALRAKREALGLTRLDLYAHPEDHAAIKTYAAKLQRKRLTAAKRSGTLAAT